jgi:ubiquinone/menaquinone biosynthesis C-methylase UbiE
MSNIDKKTVDSFGDEWTRYNQDNMSSKESSLIFDDYFNIFPWDILPKNSIGFDMGCGGGRWAEHVAPRVGTLNCIDPSDAIDIAKIHLKNFDNINYIKSSVDNNFLEDNSQDFGYSLGVLHHIPDTKAAIGSCVKILKSGSPLLLYLYYALDGRPFWFKFIWRMSNILRAIISRLPNKLKFIFTDLIAFFIYLPLAKLSKVFEKLKISSKLIPLSYYKDTSFFTMRTDARDRLGTPLEQRFTKLEITKMMEDEGLENIKFSDSAPFWCVVGYKKNSV